MLNKLNNTINRFCAKSLPGLRSSISDDGTYPEFCRLAAWDSKKFTNFRSNNQYTHILEHVSEEIGLAYYSLLSPQSKTDAQLREAANNDLVGNPRTMEISEGIKLSPTTLRYMKVADDFRKQFGDLKGARI